MSIGGPFICALLLLSAVFFPLLRKHGKQLIPSLQHHHGSLAYWLRSLLDAIHDCRDKANALDWAAWNRNYF
jgi:hypothetical protein